MEITKRNLVDLINNMGDNIDKLKVKLIKQARVIEDLKFQNEKLKQSNNDIFAQIKKYIEELEQIRRHHVNSNNNISGEKI